MNTVKSKIVFSGALLAESSLVFAHSGDHGVSSWHHFLSSPDHAAALVLVALAVLVTGVSALHSPTGTGRAVTKKANKIKND
jgi:hypothetical protein